METFEVTGSAKILRERLGEGPLTVQDALSYAALLADALRAIHDEGRAHGRVTPDAIVLTPAGLELLPAVPGVDTPITPYTAPEVAGERQPADAGSDIFSFAAVLFEMLTGRPAFEGHTEAALVASLCGSPAPNSGNPAADRLLAGCFAKDPAARWQRMEKIQLELKLLIAGARHTDTPAAERVSAPISAATAETALRLEIVQLESRMNARLAAQDQSIAELQMAVNDAVVAIRGQLSALSLRLSTAQTQAEITGETGQALEAAAARIGGEIRSEFQELIDHLSRRIAYLEQSGIGSAVVPDEVTRIDSSLDRVRKDLRELHQNMAADFHEFEIKLNAHSTAIDSARTAMAQTDELVERVVEALESLQSSVLEHAEERMLSIG